MASMIRAACQIVCVLFCMFVSFLIYGFALVGNEIDV